MTQSASFVVEGMSCAACAGRVERALRAVPGVSDANVNLMSSKAQVTFGGAVDTSAVSQALAKAGYPVAEVETHLTVDGMTCASCVGRVEKSLKAAPGVLSASVNLATEEATVRYASGATSPGELAAAITKAGYAAHPKRAENRPQRLIGGPMKSRR